MIALVRLLYRTARSSFLLATFVSILAGFFGTVLIALVNGAISAPPTAGSAQRYVVTCGVALTATIGSHALLLRISQDMLVTLRMVLARAILAAPLRSIEQAGSSKLLAALTDDVQTISIGAQDIPTFFTACASITACMLYMTWLSPKGVVLIALIMALGLGTYALMRRASLAYYEKARNEKDRTLHHLQGLINGIKELKLSPARRAFFADKELEPTLRSYRRTYLTAHILLLAGANFAYLLFFVAIGTLLFARNVLSLPEPVVVGYALAILYMRSSLEFLVESMKLHAMSGISLRKLTSLGLELQTAAEFSAAVATKPLAGKFSRLELSDVTCSHPQDGQPGFRVGPLSLSLAPGRLVFITGGNGGGKSTLAKLIAGLYRAEAGEVRMDGILIDESNLDWYRQHFYAIFMDYHLFDTVLTDTKHEVSQVERLLRELRLDKKVSLLGGRFSTTALSSGQRRRLALIAAIIDDRPIYIFDEWASDQDPVFKRIFYMEILKELRDRGKLVIVISHDDRYFGLADETIKLEDGRLSDEDTAGFISRNYA